MAQFDRKYELIISSPPVIDSTAKNITPQDTSKIVTKEGDFRTVDELDAKIFTELQLTCTVGSLNKKGSSQTSNIEVKGMSDDNLRFIRKNGVVILKAAYKDTPSLPILLAGQIVKKEVDTSGDTSSIKISISDGYIPTSSVKVSRDYPDKVSYLAILQDLANIYAENGIPLGRDLGSLETLQGVGVDLPADQIVLENGYNLVGYLDTCLGKVCKECGFTYYLSSSKLYIEPENYTQTVSNFTFTNDQILSLKESTVSTNNNAKDNQEQNTGYILKTYLDGRIEVGSFITLTVEGESKGSFKVVKVTHNLNYEGEEWFTTMELQNV